MEKKSSIIHQFFKLTKIFPKNYLLIMGIVFTICLSILTVLFSIMAKNIIDAALAGDRDTFFIIVYFIIGFSVLSIILQYLEAKTLGNYTEGGIAKLRQVIGKKFVDIKFNHLAQSHSGDNVSRATNDVAKVRDFTTNSLPFLIGRPIAAIGAIIYLFILSWKLALLSLILIPILLFISNLLTIPMGGISKKLQEKLGRVNSVVTDFIKGIEVGKAYNLENVIGKKHDHSVDESVQKGKQLAGRSAVLDSVAMVISIIPFIVTFVLGGYWVSQKEMTVGGLLAFINLLNSVTFPIAYIPYILGESRRELASADRLFEVIDQEEEQKTGESLTLNQTNHLIEFKHVNFTYPNQEEALFKDLNFKIQWNESVAFVGSSGSGKTTIMRLMLGYYDNYEGEILIGGHELKEWKLSSLRELLSFVSQDTFLFPETIEENIRYGKLNASNQEIIQSAKHANADEFITLFEEGYNSQIGELGNTLSGGQKQRITISRAILKNAPIFLLDEATSALDTESETLIQKTLDEHMKDKTSVLIAHRLSTIKNANKIYVLSKGKIVEEGIHEELLEKEGVYTSLYKKQLTVQEEGVVSSE